MIMTTQIASVNLTNTSNSSRATTAQPRSTDSGLSTTQLRLTEEDREELRTLRQNLKAITLHLWGTILDDHHPPADTILYSARRQQFLLKELQRLGYPVAPDAIEATYKHAWECFDDLWRQQIAFGAEEGVRAMLQYLKVELPDETRGKIVRFFEEMESPPLPLNGVVPAIQALAQRYSLGLISDTAWTPGRVLRRVLADYQMLDCFRVLVFSGEVGRTKPHPELFQKALRALSVNPEECLHVGDLQHTDIAGAKALGMRTAWIHRPIYAGENQKDHSPDLVVSGVAELAELLLA